MKRITKGKMWIFAIGQLGWSILAGIISNWLVYFYQPDQASQELGQTLFIPQGVIALGLFTVIGLITFCGRIFDAVTDPWIASLSDRCKSKDGRRIPFMRAVAIPFAIMTVLVFVSPVNGISIFNSITLFVTIILFYLCMTIYCTPYNALIAELGRNQEDRLNISTFISVTFIVGTSVAYTGPMIWGKLEPYFGRVNAMRMTFAGMAVLAVICMLVPVFGIKEKEYVVSKPSESTGFESLAKTFENKYFRIFVCSDISYFIGLTIFQTGLPFYVTSLLGLAESMTTILFVGMTLLSLLFYVPVNILARKYGKKKLIVIAFAIFTGTYLFTACSGDIIGFNRNIQAFIIIASASIPMATLGILPQAIVADIAEADSIETKENREGMFYAARTFAFKLGQSLAMILFTGLATIGKDVGSNVGYRITAVVAAAFCITGGLILSKYNEKKVMATIEENNQI